jgi:hypothetical protein
VIPLVVSGNLSAQVAGGDFLHDGAGFLYRPDHGVEGLVHAFYDLAIVAGVLGGISTGGESTFHRGLGQQDRIRGQRIDRCKAGVEMSFDRVEVPVVGVGNLGRNITLADAVDIIRRHVQRTDHRIQSLVDAFDDLAEVALVLTGICTCRELALNRCLRQHRRIR